MRFAVLVLDTHLDPIAGAPISLTEAGGDAVIPFGQTDENGLSNNLLMRLVLKR
ncbi:Ig-like domain-containing protein [Dehalococcoidia bacterium]|nr:Ig-like domain-containing protein [Dehalococcoidia bacterium]